MGVKLVLASLLVTMPTISFAEDYQSFNFLEYTAIDFGPGDDDGWAIGTQYYFDERSTLGPLDQFVYINDISQIGAAYGNFSGNDSFAAVGEYFFSDFVIGGTASDDGFERAWFGYFFTDNFLAKVEAADDFDGTDWYLSARYQKFLTGVDYFGIDARIDDGLDRTTLSVKYFKGLANGRYFAFGARLFHTNDDSYAALDGSYYWNERTSASLGLGEDGLFEIGAKHFFNKNFSVDIGYQDQDDLNIFSVRVGAQF